MKISFRRVQPAIQFASQHLDENVRLEAVAAQAAMSPFHLHRIFSAIAGETPKQFTLRLRLERAAALLLGERESIFGVALACGFESHEGFTRAFRRRFGVAPSTYRVRGFATAVTTEQAHAHQRLVDRIGPCVALFHTHEEETPWRNVMTYDVAKEQMSPQTVLVGRRRVPRSEIAAAIGEVLPRVFQYAQERGLALTGQPFVRYLDAGPGLMTIEPGMRVALPDAAASAATSEPEDAGEEDRIRRDALPGGFVATTVHAGPYETLPEAYAAVETWMETEGLAAKGAPWETYLTDPTTLPDPKDWRTEVCWPVG